MTKRESDSVQLAKQILDGQRALRAQDALTLCSELKAEKQFGYAREILALVRQQPIDDAVLRRKLRQQHALCTYKDPELVTESALDDAIAILTSEDEDLRTTHDQETLGIAGAIYKRKWEIDGNKEQLERSLAYYGRGRALGIERDDGYTAINTAYVLDLLASLDEALAAETGAEAPRAPEHRRRASEIREELVATLAPRFEGPGGSAHEKNWWLLVTLAEACFGLGRYEEAREWLRRARAVEGVPDWELEATARQLGSLSRIRDGMAMSAEEFNASEAASVIREFLGERTAGALTAFVGKVGLALSGGGFRASLFHIGVLAKLAEFDVLRHVEVLSCVSGGSIIGAHYYLELRKRLKAQPDATLTRQVYLEIVEQVEKDFVRGVQTDIRNSVFKDPRALARMLVVPRFNRTTRIGELFEEKLYAEVKDGEESDQRLLTNLVIVPPDEPPSFHPKRDNWRRAAKVPILILNATALNTGHNWQFTANWMGEPTASIEDRIDGNYRLRRLYNWDAPAPHDRVRLGIAVAASACVPGLFGPITLSGLYAGKTVRLVDGGVHDNQGVFSLLEQDCTTTLVSDASGQMEPQDKPSRLSAQVPLRSNSILMATVRAAHYRGLETRRRASPLRELMYVHLKKGLPVEPVDWIRRGAPALASHPATGRDTPPETTSYGIPIEVQRRLAAIRTDLDSFSTDEAHALMLSGYLMTEKEFPAAIRRLPAVSAPRHDWDFLALEKDLNPTTRSPERYRQLLDELDIGRHRFLRGARKTLRALSRSLRQ
jgi:predicted acylesterase/phospholipase RssA